MGAEHGRHPRVTFLNDPTDISGSRDREVTNARDNRRVQGGNNYHVKYTRLYGGLLVEGSYSRHNGELSDFAAAPGPRNAPGGSGSARSTAGTTIRYATI